MNLRAPREVAPDTQRREGGRARVEAGAAREARLV